MLVLPLCRLSANSLSPSECRRLFDPSSSSLKGSDSSLCWLLFRVLLPTLLASPPSEDHSTTLIGSNPELLASDKNTTSATGLLDDTNATQHCDASSTFSDIQDEISDYLDRVFSEQLEELGLWHHAILTKLGCLNKNLITKGIH